MKIRLQHVRQCYQHIDANKGYIRHTVCDEFIAAYFNKLPDSAFMNFSSTPPDTALWVKVAQVYPLSRMAAIELCPELVEKFGEQTQQLISVYATLS